MTNYFGRSTSQQPGSLAAQPPRAARSAALLIDFDNVTLGVHSDLGRELKALINSEVFRGKIAVRRAYADWRRFPNYVVPLTEASIDLIFAPAYGSSKKNTTDLRMSADAIELAFTRPEIDTFILLTGDSDFSSTVMKLKEYGKFVIGVGMRESSSDLIIQNCDEYFSYHALTGLTRSTAGEGMREDPWELVARAAQRMKATGDAMRTDRLKQVMLSLDPGFNEKEIGYTKFSRFVSEAEKKGLLRLHKLPDGQYEIQVDGTETPAAAAAQPETRYPREARDGRRDGRRDRGRRREPSRAEAEAPPAVASEISPPAAEEAPLTPSAAPVQPAMEAPAAAPAAALGAAEPVLALLQRAVQLLSPREGGAVRDGDVKRKMLDMEPSFDETKLGYSKFSRFLRYAHDQEAIDLQRLEGGQYEVKLGSRRYVASGPVEAAMPRTVGTAGSASRAAGLPAEPTAQPTTGPAERPAAASRRGRTRGRGPTTAAAGPPPLLPGQVVGTRGTRTEEVPAATTPEAAVPVEARPEAAVEAEVSTGAVAAEAAAAEAVAELGGTSAEAPVAEDTAPAAAPQPTRLRGRRGRKGVPAVGSPPPPLPGQAVAAPAAEAAPTEDPAKDLDATSAAEETATSEAAESEEDTSRKRRRGGRGRKRKTEETAAPTEAGAEAAAATPAAPAFSAQALGLPEDRDSILNYLTKSYKGVGKKTVELLLEAFGEDMFRVFAEEPQRVNEVLGDRRATTVLDQWAADYERRQKSAAPATQSAPQTAAPEATDAAESSAAPEGEASEAPAELTARPRRRGGRGRKRKADGNGEAAEAAEAAEAPSAPEAAPQGTAASQEASEDEEMAPRRSRTRGRGGRGKSSRGKKTPTPSA